MKKPSYKDGGSIPDFSRLTFKEAFAAARGGPGVKTPMNDKFTWNGKTYNTKLAEPKAAPAAKAEAPKSEARSESPAKASSSKESSGSSNAATLIGAGAAAALGAAAASRRSASSDSGRRTAPTFSTRGGGGSGGASGPRQIMPGAELDPKEMMRRPRDEDDSRFADEGNPNYRKGGKVKAYAKGGMVHAPASEPKRSYPKKR